MRKKVIIEILFISTHPYKNWEFFLLIILILFFSYLVWKIKEIYKNIKSYLYERKGKAEKKAIKLLKKNGYKI